MPSQARNRSQSLQGFSANLKEQGSFPYSPLGGHIRSFEYRVLSYPKGCSHYKAKEPGPG